MMKFTIPGQLLLLCPKRIKLTSSIYGSKLANYSFDTQCVGNQDVSDDRQHVVLPPEVLADIHQVVVRPPDRPGEEGPGGWAKQAQRGANEHSKKQKG